MLILEGIGVLEVVVPEVVQLLEDDVVRLEVEHPEVAQCPPHTEVVVVSCCDVLLLEVFEALSGVEVDVITELWPVDALQELDVMLSSRSTSDLSALTQQL